MLKIHICELIMPVFRVPLLKAEKEITEVPQTIQTIVSSKFYRLI